MRTLGNRLRILEFVRATSRSFLHGQYGLWILWTVVHGYHSVTFQEAWNVYWIAWLVRHHIAILTGCWTYGMHTHTHMYIYIYLFNNLQFDTYVLPALLVGMLVVNADRLTVLTTDYVLTDWRWGMPIILLRWQFRKYFKKTITPLCINIILPRSILLTTL